MMKAQFDANGNPVQPSGIRRTLSGALQFATIPDTTMTAEQWSQYGDRLHARAELIEANGERVTVIAPGSRDVRVQAGH